jgi:nucleoid-associated protein YgaU
MKIKGTVFSLLAMVVALLLLTGVVYGQQEKIKMDEYKAQLTNYQKTEADANAQATSLQKENAALKQQIDETQKQVDAEWAAIYAMLGTDKAGVDAFKADLDGVGGQIDALAALSPEELFRRKDEIKDIEAKLTEAKNSKLAFLTDIENRLADLDAKLAMLKAKLSSAYEMYTVLKGDYLWNISKKKEIYDDPYQWIRIYCVNKDQIKNPDLIHPAQVLKITRSVGENEYLVVKGDNLKKIAGMPSVLNDPTKWIKIYEANKDIIKSNHMVYPHQVLTIPRD